MKRARGSSLLEVVFSVGIIALVLSGVVVLVVYLVAQRTGSSERKQASLLAETVMEGLVGEKEENPTLFWQLTEVEGETMDAYPGYSYSIGFTNLTVADNCGGDCVDAVVKVGWSGSDSQVEFRRFFSK